MAKQYLSTNQSSHVNDHGVNGLFDISNHIIEGKFLNTVMGKRFKNRIMHVFDNFLKWQNQTYFICCFVALQDFIMPTYFSVRKNMYNVPFRCT